MGEPLDRQLSPLGLRAMAALAPRPGERVLDVGCGAGQTLVQLAQMVGPDGAVVGVDIEPLMIDLARRRTVDWPQVSLLEDDAQTVALPAGAFDALFSRFGVMVFADPVAAFRNLHSALTPKGRLAFVCWRGLAENPLDLVPLRAAGLEAMADEGPFSFADPDRIRGVLASAGFRNVVIAPHDEPVSSGGLEDMLAVLLQVGALGRILRETPALRPDADARVRRALADHDLGGVVSLIAATWIVTADA